MDIHFFGSSTFLYNEQSKFEYKAETVCSLFRCHAKTFKKFYHYMINHTYPNFNIIIIDICTQQCSCV